MNPILIHPPAWTGLSSSFPLPIWVWLLLWVGLLALPLLGWLFAAALAPRGAGSALARGAGALGLVPPGLLLFIGGVRLFLWGFVGVTGSPARWLDQLWPVPAGQTWSLLGTLLVLAIGYGLAALPVAMVAAVVHLLQRRERPFRVPQGDVAGSVLLVGAFLSVLLLIWGYQDRDSSHAHHWLDVVAIGPLSLVCLAIWTRYSWAPLAAPEQRPAAPDAPGPSGPDVVALWRQIGALSAEAKPLYALGRQAGAEGEGGSGSGGSATVAWRYAGGAGAAPRALVELRGIWQAPDQGWLIPDLPDPTERAVLTTALLLAIREDGLPCLVVCQSPAVLRDAVDGAIRASGAWSCGPLVAGEEALRAAFAGGRMPAAAFVDVDELSAEGIRALAGDLDGPGAAWARNIGLVVLSQVDRGDPLAVTHRMFTLQRLGLALQAVEARWSILATGFGGEATRAMVEKVFPGIPMREVPLGARSHAVVRVWLAESRFRTQDGPPWVRRAAEPIVAAGLPVAVGDPGGSFGQRGVEIWGGQVRIVRDVALGGRASASALDEAWLVASYRALDNRVLLEGDTDHDALWGLADNPVTRFLTRDQNLLGLLKNRQLKPPRPLFGSDNLLVARTHLQACLREGQQSLPALRGVFGDSLVDEELGADAVPDRFAVRRHQGRRERVPLAPMRVNAAPLALRNTVTARVIAIRHAHSGQPLAEVDAVCAATRYYPGRVFAVHEDRYQVPAQAFDSKRSQILVEPVSAAVPLTRPLLAMDVREPLLIEAPQQSQGGGLSFWTATFEASINERVSGYRRPDGAVQNYLAEQAVSARYRTTVRGVFFDATIPHNALFHLARSFDGVLVAHLFAVEEDLEVFPCPAGFHERMPAGILIIDRFILGMGAARAISPDFLRDALRWVAAILAGCKCPSGCRNCTPGDVLDVGPDKAGVLRALGHR